MKIDWKYLSTTPGYKSLKAAYIADVQDIAKHKYPIREKAELYRKFQWVINRAKHYAYHRGVSIWTILDFWEQKREYWWINYYQDCNQPKHHSNSKKPISVKGQIKEYKKRQGFYGAKYSRERILLIITGQQLQVSKKKKKRWTAGYKKSIYR